MLQWLAHALKQHLCDQAKAESSGPLQEAAAGPCGHGSRGDLAACASLRPLAPLQAKVLGAAW